MNTLQNLKKEIAKIRQEKDPIIRDLSNKIQTQEELIKKLTEKLLHLQDKQMSNRIAFLESMGYIWKIQDGDKERKFLICDVSALENETNFMTNSAVKLVKNYESNIFASFTNPNPSNVQQITNEYRERFVKEIQSIQTVVTRLRTQMDELKKKYEEDIHQGFAIANPLSNKTKITPNKIPTLSTPDLITKQNFSFNSEDKKDEKRSFDLGIPQINSHTMKQQTNSEHFSGHELDQENLIKKSSLPPETKSQPIKNRKIGGSDDTKRKSQIPQQQKQSDEERLSKNQSSKKKNEEKSAKVISKQQIQQEEKNGFYGELKPKSKIKIPQSQPPQKQSDQEEPEKQAKSQQPLKLTGYIDVNLKALTNKIPQKISNQKIPTSQAQKKENIQQTKIERNEDTKENQHQLQEPKISIIKEQPQQKQKERQRSETQPKSPLQYDQLHEKNKTLLQLPPQTKRQSQTLEKPEKSSHSIHEIKSVTCSPQLRPFLINQNSSIELKLSKNQSQQKDKIDNLENFTLSIPEVKSVQEIQHTNSSPDGQRELDGSNKTQINRSNKQIENQINLRKSDENGKAQAKQESDLKKAASLTPPTEKPQETFIPKVQKNYVSQLSEISEVTSNSVTSKIESGTEQVKNLFVGTASQPQLTIQSQKLMKNSTGLKEGSAEALPIKLFKEQQRKSQNTKIDNEIENMDKKFSLDIPNYRKLSEKQAEASKQPQQVLQAGQETESQQTRINQQSKQSSHQKNQNVEKIQVTQPTKQQTPTPIQQNQQQIGQKQEIQPLANQPQIKQSVTIQNTNLSDQSIDTQKGKQKEDQLPLQSIVSKDQKNKEIEKDKENVQESTNKQPQKEIKEEEPDEEKEKIPDTPNWGLLFPTFRANDQSASKTPRKSQEVKEQPAEKREVQLISAPTYQLQKQQKQQGITNQNIGEKTQKSAPQQQEAIDTNISEPKLHQTQSKQQKIQQDYERLKKQAKKAQEQEQKELDKLLQQLNEQQNRERIRRQSKQPQRLTSDREKSKSGSKKDESLSEKFKQLFALKSEEKPRSQVRSKHSSSVQNTTEKEQLPNTHNLSNTVVTAPENKQKYVDPSSPVRVEVSSDRFGLQNSSEFDKPESEQDSDGIKTSSGLYNFTPLKAVPINQEPQQIPNQKQPQKPIEQIPNESKPSEPQRKVSDKNDNLPTIEKPIDLTPIKPQINDNDEVNRTPISKSPQQTADKKSDHFKTGQMENKTPDPKPANDLKSEQKKKSKSKVIYFRKG